MSIAQKQTIPFLEHLNISVINPDKTAKLLCDFLNWTIRWSGDSMDDGYTVHVGSSASYLALYTKKDMRKRRAHNHSYNHNLNHICVVVDKLELYQKKAVKLGLKPFNFRDYGPCQSFYVIEDDGLEIEVTCYALSDLAHTKPTP